MAEVLVLVDHVDGDVRKTTAEMLTVARHDVAHHAGKRSDRFAIGRTAHDVIGGERVDELDKRGLLDGIGPHARMGIVVDDMPSHR